MRSCSFSEAGVVAMVRFGFAGAVDDDGDAVSRRAMLPQAESVRPTHSKAGAAQRRRILPSRGPTRSVTSATLGCAARA